jgi:hypothetical protein
VELVPKPVFVAEPLDASQQRRRVDEPQDPDPEVAVASLNNARLIEKDRGSRVVVGKPWRNSWEDACGHMRRIA